MLSGSIPPGSSVKAPNKRSLFSKPSWSKPQNLDSSDLFHRSDQTYINSTAEAERRRKVRLSKKEHERARHEENEDRAAKRRCISADEAEDEEDDDGDDDDDDESCSDESACRTSVDRSLHSAVKSDSDLPKAPPSPPKSISSLIENYQKKIAESTTEVKKAGAMAPTVIDLDNDSDTERSETSVVKAAEVKMAAAPEDVTASDEEFPELAKKAREKARRKHLEQDVISLTPDLNPSSEYSSYISPPRPPQPPPEPVLQILITSSIPNTTPLIVCRKLGQRLKDVRLAWANRQQFSNDFIDNVFLTWRGKRLFDVTTCKSLGVTVDPYGRALTKGDVLGDDEGRIHMEAMTLEILEARRKAKTKEATEAKETECTYETQEQADEKLDQSVRIILKAQGIEEFKLKVKATTTISRILNAFSQARGIKGDKDVYIMFEGERLDPDSTVEDAEIADMDSLDTYIK